MKIVIGLGNPGKKYESTRHNVGFMILDRYLGNVDWKESHKSLIYETKHGEEKIIFMKPMTYMNNSGDAIIDIISYYKLTPDDILVIQDDIDLPLGKIRVKYDSSDGGHNGIKSITKNLGTQKYLRLKIGLAKEENIDTIGYVLGKLTKNEKEQVNLLFNRCSEIIDRFIDGGKDKVLEM